MYSSRQEAEEALTQWADRERSQRNGRNPLILNALAAGLSKHRIHVLTGISRTTIDDVVSEEARKAATVTLYETNSDLVCAQLGDGPVWDFGPVTPDMYSKFTEDAAAWCTGEWEPSENDGQSVVGSTDGLRPVAEYDGLQREVFWAVGPSTVGGAARLYIQGDSGEGDD